MKRREEKRGRMLSDDGMEWDGLGWDGWDEKRMDGCCAEAELKNTERKREEKRERREIRSRPDTNAERKRKREASRRYDGKRGAER